MGMIVSRNVITPVGDGFTLDELDVALKNARDEGVDTLYLDTKRIANASKVLVVFNNRAKKYGIKILGTNLKR